MSLKPEERPEELAPAWCLLAEDTGVTAGFAAQGSGTEQDPELGESCLRPIPVRTESRRRDVGGGGGTQQPLYFSSSATGTSHSPTEIPRDFTLYEMVSLSATHELYQPFQAPT